MNAQEQVKEVRDIVRHYFEENSMYAGIDDMSTDNKEHVINIGASILCTKWDIGHKGGSFVQAVVANDLSKALGCADYINEKALKFYCQLIQNVGMIDVTDDEVKGAF